MISVVDQLFWLMLNIYMEARGEPYEGKIAVAHVVLNRTVIRSMSIKEIVMQKYQFSWVDDGVPDLVNDLPALAECMSAAFECLSRRTFGHNMYGADHYFNLKKLKGKKPNWARVMEHVATIGDHEFYRSKVWKNIN